MPPSPSQELVKSRENMNNVSCCRVMTEIMMKKAENTIQSIIFSAGGFELFILSVFDTWSYVAQWLR